MIRPVLTLVAGMGVSLVCSLAVGQQLSDDISKRLDTLMRRIEQQDKVIQAQDEKIRRQEEKIQQQQRLIEALQKKSGKTPSDERPDALTPKQEQKVEELVRDYLSKEENRISLGLEGVVAGYRDGFFLASRDQAYKMKFTGSARLDGKFPESDSPTASTFQVRRLRPTLEGTLAKYYNFRVEPDFALGKAVLKDGYLELAYFGDVWTTRLGKFKVPQGLEQFVLAAGDVPFVERSLIVNIMPERDVGVMAYGKPFGGLLEWYFGVWNGNDRFEWRDRGKDSDVDNNDDKDFGGRIQLSPFKNSDIALLKGIQLGGWFNYGRQEDAYDLGKGKSVLTYSTGLGTPFFKTFAGTSTVHAVRQDGQRTRAGWDAVWLFGPVKFVSEFDVMSTHLTRQATPDGPFYGAQIPTIAWMVEATLMLTGEPASLKWSKPKNDFDLAKGTWGAFELAARYSRLEIDSKVWEGFAAPGSTDGAWELALGLNWYLNKFVQLNFDWVHTGFDSPVLVSPTSGIGSARSLSDEDAFMFRTLLRW